MARPFESSKAARRPSFARSRAVGVVAACAVLGIALGLRQAASQQRASLQGDHDKLGAFIQSRLDAKAEVVESVHLMFDASEYVSPEEFTDAVTPLFGRHRAVHSVAVFEHGPGAVGADEDGRHGLAPDYELHRDHDDHAHVHSTGLTHTRIDPRREPGHSCTHEFTAPHGSEVELIRVARTKLVGDTPEAGLRTVVVTVSPTALLLSVDQTASMTLATADGRAWSNGFDDAATPPMHVGFCTHKGISSGDFTYTSERSVAVHPLDLPRTPMLVGAVLGIVVGVSLMAMLRTAAARRRLLLEHTDAVREEVRVKTAELSAAKVLLEQAVRDAELEAARTRRSEAVVKAQQLAVDAAEAGTWDWDIANDEVTTNRWWHEILGYAHPGKPVSANVFFDLIHMDDCDDVAVSVGRCHEGTDDHYDTRFRMLHADGSYRWIRSLGRVLERDADGQPLRMLGQHIDVTEEVEAKAQLAAREELLSIAKRGLDEAQRVGQLGNWTYDLATGAIEWSDYLYELFDRDPALGPPAYDEGLLDFTPESREILDRAVRRAATTGEDYTVVLETRSDNTTCRFVQAIGKARLDERGAVIGLFGTARNVTEQVEREGALKAATEAAEAASRAKSDFLANMSHEIRTPMSAILGFAELLAECDHPTDRMRHAETIKRNGEHLLSLINDILDLSRIESGKLELERITCQPAKIAREAADLLRVRAEGKAIELKVEIDDGIGHVRGDPTRIRQVVVNLLGNAVKFTESGSVTLRLIGEGVGSGTTRVRFEVEDTGEGIAPENQATIFKHFEQADSSMARNFGGSGLGLAISVRLAAQMNGGIALDRSTPGQGSTFSFTFDAPTAEGVAPDAANDAPVAHAPGATADEPLAGIRVLLAEDGKDNQRLITFHLKKLGASPELADNGRVAVDAYNALEDQGLTPDLILMDMQMPEMDGYTATAMLRNQGVTAPIIALTAHAMAGDREKCLDAGCDDYLTKPVDRGTLRDAILSHVRNNPDSRRAA